MQLRTKLQDAIRTKSVDSQVTTQKKLHHCASQASPVTYQNHRSVETSWQTEFTSAEKASQEASQSSWKHCNQEDERALKSLPKAAATILTPWQLRRTIWYGTTRMGFGCHKSGRNSHFWHFHPRWYGQPKKNDATEFHCWVEMNVPRCFWISRFTSLKSAHDCHAELSFEHECGSYASSFGRTVTFFFFVTSDCVRGFKSATMFGWFSCAEEK